MAFTYTGKKIVALYESITFFLIYLGCLFFHLLKDWKEIAWHDTLVETFRAGARMVIPLVFISMLLGASLTLSIHYLLVGFKLHNQAMELVQGMIIRDFTPLPIGFVLCVHSGFNMIDSRALDLKHANPDDTILKHIIPLILGVNGIALLLYTYVFFSVFIGIFLASYYVLEVSADEYLLRLHQVVYVTDIMNSILKTLLYASIVSLITGYYSFEIAHRQLAMRAAVSRIITRGLFWLIAISVFLKT